LSAQSPAPGKGTSEYFHSELLETDSLHFSRGQRDSNNATVETEINIAPFAQTDRRSRTKGDKRVQELQTTISQTFQTHLFTHLYPRSTISIALHVLSLDGALLAACLNAASLALVDAGVPMPSILAAVTSGHITSTEDTTSSSDPVLDLSNAEEQELPFLSVATVAAMPGEDDKVSVLVTESRIQVEQGAGKLDGMLALGVDGCKRVRKGLEDAVRGHGAKVLRGRR
jgi:exosome complex component RRP41